MKRIRSCLVVAALALTTFEACAQNKAVGVAQLVKRQAPKGITKAFYVCLEKADSNADPLGLAVCQTNEKKAQDDRLNAVYKTVLAKLNDKDKETLTGAQRSWLEFHRKSEEVENSLYEKDGADGGFDVALKEIFRLCERANTLDTYLDLAKNP